MKVLLGAFNARYTHSNLALRTLREPIRKAGHQVTLKEFTINQDLFEVLDALVGEAPQVILFSVYIWNAQTLRRILPELPKILPQCLVILGGPEAGFSPGRWLGDFPFLKGIISGPGESAVEFLARHGFDSFPPAKILHKQNPPFSQLPFPYLEEDFPYLKGHYIYYESSRGCPFTCSYCLSSRTDQELEFRSPDQTVQEVQKLLNWNPEPGMIVKFVDRTFNVRSARAREIWKHLGEIDTKALFHFEIHPQLLDEEDFRILAAIPPGRFQFEIGIQSVNPETLNKVNRTMDWKRSRIAIEKLLSLDNIHLHLDLIAGLPGESLADFCHSFNEVFEMGAPHIQVGFLKILPGTEIADNIFDLGIQHLESPPYEVLSTQHMSFQDLEVLRGIEGLVDSLWNSGHFPNECRQGIERAGSPFQFFKDLLNFAQDRSFDLHSKSPGKLKPFLDQFFLHFPKN